MHCKPRPQKPQPKFVFNPSRTIDIASQRGKGSSQGKDLRWENDCGMGLEFAVHCQGFMHGGGWNVLCLAAQREKIKALKLLQANDLIFKHSRSGSSGGMYQQLFKKHLGPRVSVRQEHEDRRCQFTPYHSFCAKKGPDRIRTIAARKILDEIRLGPISAAFLATQP
ncbi:hypothetical protein GWK47_054514 [Chionoecetes opilio]|uniref:Uncharacterized protein n=1 Tax=Chionoecetes opilio TaxID=41210 RepID=A0A8J4Y9P5_CHIOP|nr:hypothetical protein GWK47_054514 [Chionoecetes opilio]